MQGYESIEYDFIEGMDDIGGGSTDIGGEGELIGDGGSAI